MDNARLAELLRDGLALRLPPVALAFVRERPAGVAEAPCNLPSACALWRAAEARVLYAPIAAHANCPIGAMVMGFQLTPEMMGDLQGVVEAMCQARYLDAAEAGRIPSLKRPGAGIVYGPLAQIEQAPDLVLVWVTPQQAMLVAEAVGTSVWSENTGARLLGRPGCAALPIAAGEADTPARATFTLGCTGMRAYTAIDEDLMLCILPPNELGKLAAELPRILEANRQMEGAYLARARQVEARPAG